MLIIPVSDKGKSYERRWCSHSSALSVLKTDPFVIFLGWSEVIESAASKIFFLNDLCELNFLFSFR